MKNYVYILAVCLFAVGFTSLSSPSRALAATCAQDVAARTDQDSFVYVVNENAQSFTVAFDCTLTSVTVPVKWVTSDPANGAVAIYSDASGDPDTLIESHDLTGVTNSFTNVAVPFDGINVLSAGTTYWIVLLQQSADIGYYAVGIGTGGSFGPYQYGYVGSGWTPNPPYSITPFLVEGTSATSTPGAPATASSTVIVDANRDFFFGLLLFLFGFIIIIWLFKGRH